MKLARRKRVIKNIQLVASQIGICFYLLDLISGIHNMRIKQDAIRF